MNPTPDNHQMYRIVGVKAILRPFPSFDESSLAIVASDNGKGEEIAHEAIDIHDGQGEKKRQGKMVAEEGEQHDEHDATPVIVGPKDERPKHKDGGNPNTTDLVFAQLVEQPDGHES